MQLTCQLLIDLLSPLQVISCPNPKSCQTPTRQQELQALQAAVIDKFFEQQRLQTSARDSPEYSPSQRRSLAGRSVSSSLFPQSSHHLSSHTSSTVQHLSEMLGRVLHNARSLVSDIDVFPSPSTPSAPLAPPPPPPNVYLHPWVNESTNAMLVDLFVASVAVHLATYSSAQCAEGYWGRLCSQCVSGYGSTGIATCRRCKSRSTNSVYYILAKLLTVILLALTMNASISDAEALQLEHEEAVFRSNAEEGDALDAPVHGLSTPDEVPQEHGQATDLSSRQPSSNNSARVGILVQGPHCLVSSVGLHQDLANLHVTAIAPPTCLLNSRTAKHVVPTMEVSCPSLVRAACATPLVAQQSKARSAIDSDVTALEQQFEDDNELDKRAAVRRHFYDYQDPVLIDAQKTIPIILRIFISYLQVGTHKTWILF